MESISDEDMLQITAFKQINILLVYFCSMKLCRTLMLFLSEGLQQVLFCNLVLQASLNSITKSQENNC